MGDTRPSSTSRARRGVRRKLGVAAAFSLVVLAALAGCAGRDIGPQDPPPLSSDELGGAATDSSEGSPSEGAGGEAEDSVEVVDSSAQDNGLEGDGGTVNGAEEQVEPPDWVQLAAVTSPDLPSAYLINVNQVTLYRFDDDSNDPPTSTCVGECTETWPPVTVKESGSIYLAGVSRDQVGAIRREDGEVQLTVGGWPIYRYVGDERPGDLNGQGVGGTWFAVSPEGQPVG